MGLFDSRLWYANGTVIDQGVVDGGAVVALYPGEQMPQWTFSPAWSVNTWYRYRMTYDAATDALVMEIRDRATQELQSCSRTLWIRFQGR